jgi:hypothetical protein
MEDNVINGTKEFETVISIGDENKKSNFVKLSL